jgi:DNA-binding winged helix-turn-helix (wHTH) protein
VSIRFGPFLLNADTRQLSRRGSAVPLSPKAFTLLGALIAARPRVVTKEALQGALWPRTFVCEANLSNLVAELRRALGDARRTPRYIRTVHGIGYAFCGREESDGEATTPSWLEWNGRRFHLAVGRHIVGRDAAATIRLDHRTVSRRHARLVVSARGTVIEDAGSKNGTFLGTERVGTTARPLTDGDLLRVGSVVVSFHAPSGTRSTITAARDSA